MNVHGVEFGGGLPFALVAGPCVIESERHCSMVAERVSRIAESLGIGLIFKSSFDKANRTSSTSFRGLGIEEGLRVLDSIRGDLGLPVLTDVHETTHVDQVASVVDVLQIPAFLCRQTDLLEAASRTGKALNVEKGQFLSPWDAKHIVDKCRRAGASNVMVTERGTSFGYNNLIVDMRSLVVLRESGAPVVFDATHSLQLPGASGDRSGGQREFVPSLVNAACAVGIDALFLEVHDDPDHAPSDGPNMVKLDDLEEILRKAQRIDQAIKQRV